MLHLSGICGNVDSGRSAERMLTRQVNSKRNINFIHIDDIIRITKLFVGDALASGKRVCVTAGAFTVGALCAALGRTGNDMPPARK